VPNLQTMAGVSDKHLLLKHLPKVGVGANSILGIACPIFSGVGDVT